MRYLKARRTLVGLCTLVAIGCSSSQPQESSSAQTALKAELMAQAAGVSSAVSALDSLAAGDTATAQSTLEGLISSGLTKMYVLRPELKANEEEAIDEAMRAAEEYAQRHKLQIAKPSP